MSQKKSVRRRAVQAAGTASALAGMARNPETRKALLAGLPFDRLKGRGAAEGRGAAAEAAVDVPAPEGLEEFGRRSVSVASSPTAPMQLAEALHDLGRLPEWFALHSAWRGDPPGVVSTGDTFAQQILLMDIPAEVRWTAMAVTDQGLALRGTGPMGIVLGLWCSVVADGAGSTVRVDVGLDGPPLRGPIGTTVVRSIDTALADSVRRLAALGSAGSRPTWTVRDEPVLHVASGRLLDPTTPVVVGVGQVVQHVPDPDGDPVTLAARALRAAADDSGAGEQLLRAADAVYAVPSASWTYRDQAALLAEAVGATPDERVQSTPYGGDGSQLLVNEAAAAVASGRSRIVLVAGAEAGSTLAALQKDGRSPDWPEQPDDAAPDRVVGDDRVANHEAETAVGLGAPVFMYALMESAVRRRLGHDVATHRAAIAGLWSGFSRIAAANPFAWSPTAVAADDLATATPDNRAISDPYTKLMCANLTVDLAAGIVVTSVAAAHAAGIPQEKWVFVLAGASASDEWFVSQRADFSTSPAIRTAGRAALDHAGLTIDDVRHVDLYSCFPAAVQIAADALGLPVDDPDRPLSVTGGLTFAGGPGNAYGAHAIATLVPILRGDPTSTGLSTSLGWYATKHSVGLYSATPPATAFAHLRPMVERPAARRVLRRYEGEVVVEATTVPYARDGAPEAAILSTLTPDGDRVLVRSDAPAVIAFALDGDPLGRSVRLDGDTVTVLRRKVAALPAPPSAPVTTRRDGAVAVVTLDRPQVRNAIDARTATALERAIDDAEADDTVRAIVLTGAGGTFCAGMDLKAAARGEFPVTERRGPLGLTGQPPTKPLVVAVEGSALAGGCELALAADLIVAADDAVFGIPEVKRGLIAAAGGVMRLRDRLPRNIAMELTLTGEPMPASRLAELGLVNRVVAPGTTLDVALDLARRIAANAPLSVAVGKRMVDEAPGWELDEAFQQQSVMASPVIMSADSREGVTAFAEGREPVWTGR
ncbi:crotonase/enoyl-CoA hydratase family protein [Aeromicrobium fastidiosum]|uniref:Crotonase/enoyl-CoA hydratase family protein n=1 Tax=Aeromicrobium fastidiosum TaxID=52699 RepID=A0A641ASZ0_9ACTN|nr:crotonase/enoyl-CoA hydratase family protein [Aeromicrobium fastidiosum]KAA1380008.1 crotonase/enoyl-CoA hydratase family protein [Aeromicrobium fastidiosum]MBP2389530.1 acetyl-CoA C-acetyltransferase [Aeromicrobium fastidiosum]